MRRIQLGLATIALPVLAMTLFLTGCKDTKTETSGKDTGKQTETTPGGDLKPVEAGKGHLKGKITLKGSAPNLEALTKDLVDKINAKADDKDKCLAGSDAEKTEQMYRLGGPGGKQVGNVFVWIKPERGYYFQISDEQVAEAKKHAVKLHQPHCAFLPHCTVLFPSYVPNPKKPRDVKETGQVVEITNDAKMSHNTKWEGPKNPGGNETLPPDKTITVPNLVPASEPVRFSCNIHTWMDGYMRVFDHPYATVSLSDTMGDSKITKDSESFGTYELKNLPVGKGKVRVAAWHESGVWLTEGKAAGEPIEIKADGPTEKDFALEVK